MGGSIWKTFNLNLKANQMEKFLSGTWTPARSTRPFTKSRNSVKWSKDEKKKWKRKKWPLIERNSA